MARANGIDYAMLTPAELREKYPLAGVARPVRRLWDPLDGDIDPAQMTQAPPGAQTRRKRAALHQGDRTGAASGRRWRARLKTGEEIIAEIVVNAAGYRAGEVMALLGRMLPTYACRTSIS